MNIEDAVCDKGAESCSRTTLLPEGIVRVTEEAIASERLVPAELREHHKNPEEPVTIAAFDFDGTCISGSSPKRLVNLLIRNFRLTPWKMFRIGLWGLAYKLNLPKDPEGVRERVFSAFAGDSAIETNDFMCQFYHKRVAPLYRQAADAEMIAHMEMGHVVVLVSASFEPIIASAMVSHPIQYALASRMQIDENGCYTGQIEGLPTEGPDKIVVLKKFADEYFGKGNWKLGWAYGDHYSDLEMLEAAENPCAVTPDGKLERVAHARGWTILDWE